MSGFRRVFILLILLLWSGGGDVAIADEMDRVQQLRDDGTILPLEKILARVERRYPGTLLNVELEEERGMVIYELEILGHDQVIRKIIVDARNGKALGVERD